MQSFRDTQLRVWTVEVTYASIMRVKAITGLVLTDLVIQGSELQRVLESDPLAVFDLLCALLKPQFESRGLTPEDFGGAVDEEVMEGAAAALMEAIIDFFQPQRRAILRRAFLRGQEVRKTVERRILSEQMRRVESPEFDAEITRALTHSGSDMNSPGSSESTPPA